MVMSRIFSMLFHEMVSILAELGEQRRAAKESQTKQPRHHLEELDVLDVNYEDVLEYYRYRNTHEENDQESS